MKKLRQVGAILILGLTTGCAGYSQHLQSAGKSSRHDIFQEVASATQPAAGYADLLVTSSVKTHSAGIYKPGDIHGTGAYKMVVNIDGQSLELHGDPRPESTGVGTLRDAEAGEGTRYRFSSNLRLKSGKHRVLVAVPADDVTVERQLVLTDGTANTLTLEPVYRLSPEKKRPGVAGASSFSEGLKGFRAILNGKAL